MSLSEQLRERELSRLREIVADPLWYEQIDSENRAKNLGKMALSALLGGPTKELKKATKDEYYGLFEQLLEEGAVSLGATGYNWDSERQPVDTFVVHHSANQPGLTAARLSAMELLRVYVPTYARPSSKDIERGIEDQPLYSSHFKDGQQIFNIYHWLVRPDGSYERHLEDSQIGMHAGNWDVNTRSIAFCIDDDLTDKLPTPETITALAEIRQEHYPKFEVKPQSVVGHGEVRINGPTECPGNLFLRGWKKSLLEAMA